jgi:hypothetical protein
MQVTRLSGLLVIAAGCGGGNSDTPIDAAHDVAIDATIDASPLVFTHYVIASEQLPANDVQATDYGFDLDGNAVVDNRVGAMLVAHESAGFMNQLTIDAWLDRGEAIMLAKLGADPNSSAATFTMHQGANPMPPPCAGPGFMNCGKHLEGTGSFALKLGAPVDPPLAGALASGQLTAGPGKLTVQFSIGFSPPITVTLIGARVELATTETTLAGKIGGAITQAEIDAQIIPALRESYAIAASYFCNPFGSPPDCECEPGGVGEKVIAQLDKNPADCGISLAEVQSDPVTAAQLAPDVMVDGQPGLSIGFGVSAVKGSFVAP